MNLVPAGAGDLDALSHFVNSAYRGAFAREGWMHEADLLGGQRTDPELLSDMVAPPSVVLLDKDASGAILGCVHVVPRARRRLYFGMLAVDPSRQGGGLGRAMVAAVEARARDEDCVALALTVIHLREALIAWYERLGFCRTGAVEPFPYHERRYGDPLREDLTLIVLEKHLA